MGSCLPTSIVEGSDGRSEGPPAARTTARVSEGMGFLARAASAHDSGIGLARGVLMLRPARLSDESYSSPHAFCFTFCTWQRQPLLVDPSIADDVVRQIVVQSSRHAVEVTVYCLMPDHIHALLTAEEARGPVRACVERVKQCTGFDYARRTGGRLWQRSYFDYTLRPHEMVEPAMAYIVNNPVRAGFVPAAEVWPFWGSSRWSREEILETVAAFGSGERPGTG